MTRDERAERAAERARVEAEERGRGGAGGPAGAIGAASAAPHPGTVPDPEPEEVPELLGERSDHPGPPGEDEARER